MCMKVILWENLIANEGEECLIDNSNGFIAYTDIEKALDDIVYNLYDIGTSIYSILNSQNIDIEDYCLSDMSDVARLLNDLGLGSYRVGLYKPQQIIKTFKDDKAAEKFCLCHRNSVPIKDCPSISLIEEAKEKGGVTYFIKGICYVVLYENGKYTLYKNAKSLFSGDILEIYKEIEKTAA